MCKKSQPFQTVLKLIKFTILISLVLFKPVFTQQVTFPKYNNIYVNDFASVINGEAQVRISQQLKEVRDELGIEFTVVTIKDMARYGGHDESIESYATALFNYWGVGSKDLNNGIMMLVSIFDRKVRIEVGSGYDGQMDVAMKYIIDNDILPDFKQSNYQSGISQGVQEIIYLLKNPNHIIDNLKDIPISQKLANFIPDVIPMPLVVFVGVILTFAGLGVVMLLIVLIIIYTFLFIIRTFKALTRRLESIPIKCKNCKRKTVATTTHQRQQALTAGQLVEHSLDSVTYKTWYCPPCDEVSVKRIDRYLDSYSNCPLCEYQTVETTETVTEAPKYTSMGSGERLSKCLNCGYETKTSYTINKRSRSYSSSDSSDSFGGGKSSGGGASGSW